MIEGGKVDHSKKTKEKCLLTLIKYESPDLYELISDLCLDGIFRSQRYKTFLMPNAALVKKIEAAVTSDEDSEAVDMIRSLMLCGHLSKGDFTKGAEISTMRFGSYNLANPEEVGKYISIMKKSIITTNEGAYGTIVYDYSGPAVETVEGAAKTHTKVWSKKGGSGGVIDDNAVFIKKITQEASSGSDHKKIISNYFKLIAGALTRIENDKARFDRAKYYLSANPIVSWYFLTMPGRSDALINSCDLQDFEWSQVSDCYKIIKEAEKSNGYEIDREYLKHTNSIRKELEQYDKSKSRELINHIKSSYGKQQPKSLDKTLIGSSDLKLLMDEMRFINDSALHSMEDVLDTQACLKVIDWSAPGKHLIMTNPSIYTSDPIKCSREMFISGPLSFVKSVYFRYIPLTDNIQTQLSGMKGGNPATISRTIFLGGAANDHLKSMPSKSMKCFLDMLTNSQRDELKQLLQ